MEDVKNITQLRESLIETYNDIRRDKIALDKARELALVAGKAIKSACAQVEYARRRREIPDIPFLK